MSEKWCFCVVKKKAWEKLLQYLAAHIMAPTARALVEPAPGDGVGVNTHNITFVPGRAFVCCPLATMSSVASLGLGCSPHSTKKMSGYAICSDQEAMLIHIVVLYMRNPSVNPHQGLSVVEEDKFFHFLIREFADCENPQSPAHPPPITVLGHHEQPTP